VNGIKEIIVVEGKSDVSAVRRAVDAEFIITSGFGITRETFARIEAAQEKKGVVIFTDPDHAGEQIRRRINARVPGCKNAFLTRDEAHKRGNIGIENAAPEHIRAALDKAHCQSETPTRRFTAMDLANHRLSGFPRAAGRRKALGKHLGIGYANAKQLLHRLNHYGITRRQFEDALSIMDESVQKTA
jgi:ribonuclease M5